MVTTTLLALRNLLFNDPDEVQYRILKGTKKKGSFTRKCKIICTNVSKDLLQFLCMNSEISD
jgi:hypothetical protein